MLDSIRNSRTVNWPNLLTVLRLLMALAVPWITLSYTSVGARFVGGIVFGVAAATDYADGQLARRRDTITNFGKMMDPIADKLLTLGAFTTLSLLDLFPIWVIIPILIREIVITVLRLYFLSRGIAVASVKSGKQKTATQISAIVVGFLYLVLRTAVPDPAAGSAVAVLSTILQWLLYGLLALAVYMTIYSGVIFFRNNWGLMKRFWGAA